MELHSPKLFHSIPAGEEESDTNSWVEPLDSGEEWDEAEHAVIGHTVPLHPWGKKVSHG